MLEILTGLFVTCVCFMFYNALREEKSYFLEEEEKKVVKKKRKISKYEAFAKTFYNFIFHTKPEDRLTVFSKMNLFYPRYTRIKFFGYEFICVYDPDLMKRIFNSQAACQRPFRNCFQLEFGLLASEYHYWKTSRKHLNMAFNINVLKGFIPIFEMYANDVVEDMKKHLDGKEFDLLYPLAQLTARSVSATMLNVNGVEVSSYDQLIESIMVFLDIMFKRMINPILQIDGIYKWTKEYQKEEEARKYTIAYGDALIKEARIRKQNECKSLKIEYIIDQLVNHEEKFSNQEIREHLLVLMITASETSARFVATTLIFLACNQDIQEKVYNEILDVFGDSNVELNYENLSQLKYMDMVLKETLRLFTPIPISARETIDELDIGLKTPLSKGTKIFLFNYVLHRRKDIWGEDAEKFNPENFSQENISKRDPYAYVPFGSGPRMCIGNRYAMMAAKIETLLFLKSYKFTTKIKSSDIKMGLSLTAKLTVDHLVSIEKRN